MILKAFKSEFSRIATEVKANYESKNHTELQDFVNNCDFDKPLINMEPLTAFNSNIGISGQVYYSGSVQLYFLTKAIKSDNFDDTKDELIDQMIELQKRFYLELHKNAKLIFQNSQWNWNNEILRQHTSNFLVGLKSTITFTTQCARI